MQMLAGYGMMRSVKLALEARPEALNTVRRDLERAMDAVFGALASVDILAWGIKSPAVRKVLDLG